MNIYENNKQLLTAMGGDSYNLATDYEVRKAILDLLGGDSSNCNSIYEVDKQILNIYLEGGGGTGGDCDLTPITITENGVYSREIGGYSEVTVNVEIPECPEIPLTAITINSNGTYIPEEGGYNEVIVDIPFGELVVSANGEYLPENGVKAYDKVTVNVESEFKRAKVLTLDIDNSCIVDGTWPAENFDTILVTNMYGMFSGCSSLKSLDLSNWDTSNVTDMSHMFNGCSSLKSLDLSNWDTSKVVSMPSIFNGCSSLQSLDVSNWNVGNVKYMGNMFNGCKLLQSLDVSNWDTSKVVSTYSMFKECQLQSLDVSNWDTSNMKDMNQMFIYCDFLQSLDLSNWDTSNVTDMAKMFERCGWKNNGTFNAVGGRTIDEVIDGNIGIMNGLSINIPLYAISVYSDRATLRALINGVADRTGQTSLSMTLGNTNKSKLTEEDIAVATAKNWTIA